jgi:hypothetical protein
MAYVLPQVQLFQEFQQLPTDVVRNLNAFVFGPNYQLFRFSEDAEKLLIGLGQYDKDIATVYSYPNQPAGSTVDTSYVELHAEAAWLKYFDVPEDSTNPLVGVSAVERNKLRAAPRIEAAEKPASTVLDTTPGGMHTGTVSLPENYYLTPAETFLVGSVAGDFDYLTTEGVSGVFTLPADATTSGVVVQGPDGIALDFDSPDTVQAPLTVTFLDDLGGTFTVSPKPSRRQKHIDDALLGSPLPLQVNIDVAGGTLASSAYDDPNRTLDLEFDVTDTLSAIRTALLSGLAAGQTEFLTEFDVSAISGAGTGDAVTAADQDSTDVGTAADIPVIPDAFRVKVFENDFVFKTANGFSRSAALLKDVEVGDGILVTVTPASTSVEETLRSTIVGLEADFTRPEIDDAATDVLNQDTLAGDDVSAGVTTVTSGSDNQRDNDFDGPDTKLYSLDAAVDFVIGDLTNSVLSDAITMTVTKAGLQGVAEVRVENDSGTYRREDVPIEAAGPDEGRVYLGNNLYVNFDAGVTAIEPGKFLVGDTYEVSATEAPFTKVENMVSSGDYAGTKDTTYVVEVTRGGVFDTFAHVIDGLVTTSLATVVADVLEYSAGDVDDEYVLTVTAAGEITDAVFKIESQRGDNATGITFSGLGIGDQRLVGANGLKLHIDSGGTPVFAIGDAWHIIVKHSRPRVRVTDSAGIDQETSVIVSDGSAVSLGLNGALITFPANVNTLGGIGTTGGLLKGDKYIVAATASGPERIQTLVLADDLSTNVLSGLDLVGDSNFTPDLMQAELFLIESSLEVPEKSADPAKVPGTFNWVASTADFTANEDITLQSDRWVDGLGEKPFIPLCRGDLFLHYRALLSDQAGSVASIRDISDVIPELGVIDVDNPLALAVFKALENSGGVDVFFTATPSDDLAGYTAALDLAEKIEEPYGLVPLTLDEAIQSAVVSHVDAMSTAEEKKWRLALVSSATPSINPVVTDANHPSSSDWMATVTDDTRVAGTQLTRVEFTENASLLTLVNVGDQVRLKFSTDAFGDESFITGEVAEVDSNTVLYLKDALDSAITIAEKTEIYHPLSVSEIATAIAGRSAALGNHRVLHIFPTTASAFGLQVTGEYVAAAVAGLISGVAPQQGLTNVQVNGFDDIAQTYSVFNRTQLNEMAEGGTFIVTQETQGGPIFVRHQLTTAALDENLSTSELNQIKNLDSISFFYADRLRPYIGRFNVTPELVEVLRTQVQDGLNFLGSFTNIGLLGPQVILANGNTNIRTIQQHPTFKDRVIITIDLELPAPLNVIEATLVV